MVSLKQLEAMYWIVELGTFDKAAVRLHTTQSTVSKRIQELEASVGFAVFDRSQRGVRLTAQGEALLMLGREMLALGDQIARLGMRDEQPVRTLQLGVTELTAWTWLPRLVAAVQARYPAIRIEPEVDMSSALFERLVDGSIELVIIPAVFDDADVQAVPLAEVDYVWMASPALTEPSPAALSLEDLHQYPILLQGARSGTGRYYSRWLKSRGVRVSHRITSDSMNATLGLTVAGLGVSYFPQACFQSLVDTGQLAVLPVAPALPPVPYAAMYREDRPSALIEEVVRLAREACDFSQPLQGWPAGQLR